MTYRCSSSLQYQNKFNTEYQDTEFDQDTFLNIVKFDHCPSVVEGGRSKQNFVCSYFLFGEVDEGISIPEFQDTFKGMAYFLSTSRNHQKMKDGKKCDRFHAWFVLDEPIKDYRVLDIQLRKLVSAYTFFDSNAKDATRFYFGNREASVLFSPGRPFPLFSYSEEQLPASLPKDEQEVPLQLFSEEWNDNKELIRSCRSILSPAHAAGVFSNREDWIAAMHCMKLEGFTLEDFMLITDEEAKDEGSLFWNKCKPLGTATLGTLITLLRRFDPSFQVRVTPHVEEKRELAKDLNQAMPHTFWYQPHVVTTEKNKKDRDGKISSDVSRKPLATIENFKRMLDFYGIRIYEDLMIHDQIIQVPGNGEEGKHQNAAIGDITSLLALNSFPCQNNLKDYITRVAHSNCIHPAREYFKSCTWDGHSRIEELMSTLKLRRADMPYAFTKMLIVKWLVSLVAATMEPEFRCRGVLVFQGGESAGKTQWFRSLLPNPKWFLEGAGIETNNKDTIEKAISHLCCELGELEGVFKRIDMANLKSFLTLTADEIRMPYERRAEKYPRRTVYCGTVNREDFLMNEEDHTRFWCIAILSCDWRFLQTELQRDQLWGEVFHLYKSGFQWWLTKEEEKAIIKFNRHHKEIDEVADAIETYWDISGDKSSFCQLFSATEIARIIGYLNPNKMVVNKISFFMKSKGLEYRKVSHGKCGFALPEPLTESERTRAGRLEEYAPF